MPDVANRASSARDREIAGGDELAAGGGRDAVHLGDHRLRKALQRSITVAAAAKQLADERLVRVREHLLQVVARRRTRAPRPAMTTTRTCVVRRDRVERGLQRVQHRAVDRVELRRAVERQRRDRRRRRRAGSAARAARSGRSWRPPRARLQHERGVIRSPPSTSRARAARTSGSCRSTSSAARRTRPSSAP